MGLIGHAFKIALVVGLAVVILWVLWLSFLLIAGVVVTLVSH